MSLRLECFVQKAWWGPMQALIDYQTLCKHSTMSEAFTISVMLVKAKVLHDLLHCLHFTSRRHFSWLQCQGDTKSSIWVHECTPQSLNRFSIIACGAHATIN
ncbi:unnamed protein product [Mesocestoides corti]|uniref:Secreted protein n=1 Tax=Mesocestoides corti TaxID=53468 RepID=A0A0R3UDS1_MESCO|nr:unnamed protein product [Mesocestoides corti]